MTEGEGGDGEKLEFWHFPLKKLLKNVNSSSSKYQFDIYQKNRLISSTVSTTTVKLNKEETLPKLSE